jgi:Leucine-rich repeat (LRR) protein
LQLPLDKLSQLQQLQLEGLKLQLPGEGDSHDSSPGVDTSLDSVGGSSNAATAALSSLQHLELDEIQFASISSLLQITRAPQLRSLLMNDIELSEPVFAAGWLRSGNSEAAVQQVAEAMPSMLQQLPRLSVLQMPKSPFTDAAVQQAAALQGLQSLSLAHSGFLPMCNLQLLPSSITRLVLQEYSLPRELSQLSGLLQLEIESGSVPPGVLGCFMQLQVLHMLDYCRLLPYVEGDNLAAEGTEALLDALLQLTHLRDLRLQLSCLDTVSTAQRFAALTASSHLTRLFLTRDHYASLPEGAMQHMFPVGRHMEFLVHLTINTTASDNNVWRVAAADLGRITQSCPKLQWLDLCGSVQPGADLSGLLQLPECCTSLLVGGAGFTDAAVPSVLQLTQLKHLSWSWDDGFTDVGLEQLVGLDLDQLYVLNCGLSVEVHQDKHGDDPVDLKSHPKKVSATHALQLAMQAVHAR